ncbi:uncharacterized protein LOC127807270 isoform X3 [Diospyros lotus]|uniref:uncharacterized protein LOC127807270 isoform X3 n=1 Tax=Diospyros lotus TaxID=55363 RepID=UPI0022502058|nr:uncharacterized protein LOC127807270 isoform X3 [Diospyros lotus]
MDKARDVRRGGASRLPPSNRRIMKQSEGLQSRLFDLVKGLDGNGGDAVFSKKLKREKMRRLNVVGKVRSSHEDGEMGPHNSDGEDDFPPTISKRIKLSRKFFHESGTVDSACVPRKLRSAMKKRNSESISLPSSDKKQPNHEINGVKLPRKDGIKKSRPNQGKDSAAKMHSIGPITKDEEEVVETLYALADMFPNSNNKKGLGGELGEEKPSPLPEQESSRPALEAPGKEEQSMPLCPSASAQTANVALVEGSAQDCIEVKCLNEPSQPTFWDGTELGIATSQRNGQAVSLLEKKEPIDWKPPYSAVGCNVQSEICLEIGSKQSYYVEAAACVGRSEVGLGPAAAGSSQLELQHTRKESKNSGPALWPGFSSAVSHGAVAQGPPLQTNTTKIPSWMAVSTSANRPGSAGEESKVPIGRASWKRCSSHVYISRLIKVLQIAENTGRQPTHPIQMTSNEGVHLAANNNLVTARDDLNGAVSADKSPGEVRNAILLHKRLLQDQQQASTTSVLYASKNQRFDLLSLSSGGGGGGRIEATNCNNKIGNWIEPPLTQFHIPYLQSLAQNPKMMPHLALQQNRFSPVPFADHLPAAAAVRQQQQQQVHHLQQASYFGSPLLGSLGSTALPQQQRQQIWTPQYKPVALPIWQNGRQDPASAIQFGQSIPPPPHSSLETLGPKYAPMAHQKQQLVAVTSPLPSARAMGNHLHSGYEINGVASYTDAASLPLQLLCNEHL